MGKKIEEGQAQDPVNEPVEQIEQDPTPAGDAGAQQEAEPEVEGEPEQEGEAVAAEGADEGEPAAPAYTPNYKYKYAVPGKPQEEREFDELFRSIIKDEESEKRVRELHAKAAGADFLLESRNSLQQGFAQLAQQHEGVRAELIQVDQALQAKDYDTFLKKFDIPFEDVLQYVATRLRYKQMSPEERAQVDQQREFQTRAVQNDLVAQRLQQQNSDLGVQLRIMQLDSAMTQPDVQSVVQAVDAKAGAGTFKNAVIQLGRQIANEHGYDAPIAELIPRVIQGFQVFLASPTQGAPATGGAGAAPAQARAKPPVIPNISGRGGSPAKKEIGSLDELRARAKALRQSSG